MAIRRKEKRSERSKIDATPPWETRKVAEIAPTEGPYDIAHEPTDDRTRVDLGALRVPISDNLEMRVDVNEAQEIVSVTLVGTDGQMQLSAFAAPRSEGIWDDVRAEILISLQEQGGSAADAAGDLGTELVGRLATDAGPAPVRFIGVDGPRWMLRAMLIGDAAADETKAAPYLDVFRNLVVVRGTDPLPVREPIPLRLPPDVADQLADPQG